MDRDGDTIEELGIRIKDFTGGSSNKPKMKAKCYNAKLKIYREFALATLSAFVESTQNQSQPARVDSANSDKSSQVLAFDAMACTGIAGIEWKKHLGGQVHVTMADHDDISTMTTNTEANSLTYCVSVLDSLRVPGDPVSTQEDKNLRIFPAEARTVMSVEAFNFIYLTPHKMCASYFEESFHSISCGGVLCLVVPDVSAFARSPHVVQRWYNADVIKTEYLKEMAARIIMASLARSAARYNKGIDVQYVLSLEDFLLICVKVSRGHGAADSSLKEIKKLLHCRFCEERIFLPNQLAPIEEPYSFLPCKCQEKNPGKTAVLLGPMWSGPIYESNFLNLVYQQGQKLHLSPKFLESAQLLLTESGLRAVKELGSTRAQTNENGTTSNKTSATSKQAKTFVKAPGVGIKDDSVDKTISEDSVTQHLPDGNKIQASVDTKEAEADPRSSQSSSLLGKRKREPGVDDQSEQPKETKRLQGNGSLSAEGMLPSANVPFYHNVNKYKRTHIPKLDKLVTILNCSGFQASRTHFDSCAIRTIATVEEFLHILN